MFVLMMVGLLLYKLKLVNDEGSRQLSNIVLYVANPACILESFCIPFDPQRLVSAGILAVFAFAAFWLNAVVCHFFFKNDGIAQFAGIFSNMGFLGIPLVSATLGSDAVFYLSIIMAVNIVAQWTWGVWLISGDKAQVSVKRSLTNPAILSVPVGLLLFCCSVTLPEIPDQVVTLLGNLNTGLAMIVVGTYLATTDIVAAVKSKKTWLVLFVRLVLLPVVTAVFVAFVPGIGDVEKMTVVITLSAPVGAVCAMFSQMFGKDPTEATGYVALSTLVSLVTMPSVLAFATLFL
jgi:hypothetical protein